jgi:adenylate cyclase
VSGPPGAHVGPALASIVVAPGSPDEELVPIWDRFFIGRECLGVDEHQRLLLDGPDVSREHLEIRLDPQRDRALVVDMSTNGTRLNGTRMERATSVTLRSGDRLQIGDVDLEFRSDRFRSDLPFDVRPTIRRITVTKMVMIVGDIAHFSTASQHTDSHLVLEALESLFGGLRVSLARHRGTLSNYVGDAFFATWELDQLPDATDLAVAFALAACEQVAELAPTLPLRGPAGEPLRMGWGAVLGDAAVSLTGAFVTVVGDATNLAFRLAGLAGRQGRAEVLVSRAVAERVTAAFRLDEPVEVEVKGRSGPETVRGVHRA